MKTYIILILLVLCRVACYGQQGLSDTVQMQEVVVTSGNAVYWSKDTMVYVADSFNKTPHNMTEDVLRKMPGIDVSINGKITIEGKEVKRIFINGTEAGVSDIKTITRNLPAEILNKIQVTDLYSDEAVATGMKDGSGEKIINLQLKKEYDGGLYGRAGTGFGNKNLYQANVFANYMKGTTRITATGLAGNTGNADINSEGADNSTLSRQPNGITSQQSIGVNYSLQSKDSKLKLSGSGEIANNRNSLLQTSLRTTFLPGDTVLYQKQRTNSVTDGLTGRLAARAIYTFSKTTSLNTNLNISSNKRSPTSNTFDTTGYNDLTDVDFTRQAIKGSATQGAAVNLSSMFQKKSMTSSRVLLLKYALSYTPSVALDTTMNSSRYEDAGSGSVNNFFSKQERQQLNQSVGMQLAQPVGKAGLASLEYTLQWQQSKELRNVLKDTLGLLYRDSVQSNEYEYDLWEHNIQARYQYTRERTTTIAGLRLQPFTRHNRYVGMNSSNVTYAAVNYFPLLNFRYKISKRTRVDANYNGTVRAPNIRDLQPTPDYRDSFNVFIGNPGLLPEASHQVAMSYNYLNPIKQHIFWVNANYTSVNNKIINQTEITAGKRVTRPLNADGVYNASVGINYTHSLTKHIKATAALNTGVSNNVTITNGARQDVKMHTILPRLQAVYSNEKLECNVSYSVAGNYTGGTNVVNNNALQVHTASALLRVRLPLKISAVCDAAFISNQGGFYSTGDRNFLLLNAGLYKDFTKPSGLVLRLYGYDLANRYPTVQRTVTDNVIEDRTYNRIGRYFMFAIIYKFNKFF